MITVFLVLAAAAALAWPWIKEHAAEFEFPALDRRHWAAVALLAAAVISYASRSPARPEPTPVTPPTNEFNLRGKFIGPTAAEDAAMLSALCDEIAGCLEHDGGLAQPRLTSGVAFDDLRVAAREGRMRGESLGARQPHVRDAIHQYLDQAVGTAGGPVSPEQRGRWVAAYRDIARAAADVTR